MLREDEFSEFKKTTGELNEAMISISSILNKHGRGTLYFGIKNDGSPCAFTINASTLRDVSRKIFEAIKPQIFPVVETVLIDNIEVIKVSFEGRDIPYSAFGKYYIRIADEDRELTPGELRKVMIGKEYEENWENLSSQEGPDDVDEVTLHKFYLLATECGRLPEIGFDKTQLLSKLGVLNGEHLTNAGRYLFSANKPIVMKMAVFATDHKTTFLDIDRKEGNIFQLINEAMNYIIKNIRWCVSTGDDGIHRQEIPEVPIEALREAVINSFVHARYDGVVQHEIDIFSNRISLVNPGSFANSFEPKDFAVRDLHSYLRNEVIAKTLYLCKDVETFGSGLKKIYSLCKEVGVSLGYINSDTDFTFEFSRKDRNIMTNDGMTIGILTAVEEGILNHLRENPDCTVAKLAVKINKSQRMTNRYLAALKLKGLVQHVGSNKAGYWKVQ